MEKLWSHTSLGTIVYLMCVFPTTALCSLSFPVFVSPPPTCLNCFVSISWTHTHTRLQYVSTHYMTNAVWDQLHSPVVRCSVEADLLYLYTCLAGWSIYWSHQWNAIPHIFDREGNNTMYSTSFCLRGVEYPVNGQLIIIFFSSCFNHSHLKCPPFRRTAEMHNRVVLTVHANKPHYHACKTTTKQGEPKKKKWGP